MRSRYTVLLRGVFYLLLFGVCALLVAAPAAAQEENLRVLYDEVRGQWMRYTDASNALYHHLSAQAYQRLEKRAEAVSQLTTQAQWRQRQKNVRSTLRDIVGPFPKKTPLRAQVVDTLNKDGYRVENLLYQSQPGFYVTASLFVPAGLEGKAPAILYCSGHDYDESYRSATYQQVILNLVKKGFIVLAFDPIGQGERFEYVDYDTGAPQNIVHSYPGSQAFISGSSLARFMIWDGIRGIDYLQSREEVDPGRIGVTGRSGGGTQSAYLGAFDERVKAVAPENYITSFRRLIESIGPQDAEQNFYHGIARGIDQADLLEVRAPKPTLMITTSRDIFSIQGARETAEEVEQAYEAFGSHENFRMIEEDAPHTPTQANREALYAFFQKHLNRPGSAEDQQVEPLDPQVLQVTRTGQVATSLEGAETVFSLNRAHTRSLIGKLNQSRENLPEHLSSAKRSAKALSGFERPEGASEAVFTGRYQREGYAVEKYFIEGKGDYVIPFLLMVPEGEGPHPAMVYLHPDGKAAEARPGGRMEWFAKQGYAVLAPDLVGTGEMGPGDYTKASYRRGFPYSIWFLAQQLSRSIVGIRAGDLIRTVNYLNGRSDVASGQVSAVARGEMTTVLLHAAAFEEAITKVALINPLVSYRSFVMNKHYDPAFLLATVAGALTAYDLPDLAATLAPRALLMAGVIDQNGEPAKPEVLKKDLAVVRSAYTAEEAREQLEVREGTSRQILDDLFSLWLR